MNDCAAIIFIEGETGHCAKVLDHTGRHEASIYVIEYGAVLVKWTQ